ncbi:hypothetical protein [Paenibacillus protaetiae]|uniref:Cation efflux protein cytoplasmic domain-containing protein n=1 Tax=Paenibacillus protaetiae TaxID=2509456 RepID=A0A4P6EZV4_9BACL|nr:hypothetical protein [Paenibacillus protaetiae]QAY67349.1 hypothetical protein ET464_14070 [Paenibacillus protaetiae]
MFNTKRMQRRSRWKLRFLLWGFSAVLLVSIIGCGKDASHPHANNYGHDGYLGLSNSNPNLPNSFSYLNIKSDGKMVRQVLEPVQGIKHLGLNFNGADLYVNVKADPSMSDENVRLLGEKVHKIVQFNMPRYHVHVTAKK